MKEIISGVAVFLTFAAYIPYYRSILKGKTHPHIYTWVLWGLVTVLIVALQIKGGAGKASWPTIAGGLLCLGVIVLSLRSGKKDITKSDKVVAILSLAAIVSWLVANQPVLSVILIILSDMFAFIPTVRKSWRNPYSEALPFYVTNLIRFCLAFAAIETYTFLSTAWIITWVVGNALFSLMLVIRRKQVKE